MNSSRSESVHTDGWETAEETMRLIARLPAPDGLVDRVQAGLRSAPRRGSLLGWRPVAMMPLGGWAQTAAFRGVAAAAIVCVVAGGGWRVYSGVAAKPTNRVIVMPARGGGFSSANAVHKPDPLASPVLTHRVDDLPAAATAKPVQSMTAGAAHGKHLRHAKPMAVAAQ